MQKVQIGQNGWLTQHKKNIIYSRLRRSAGELRLDSSSFLKLNSSSLSSDMWFPDHTELCQATIVGPTSRRNPEFDFNGGTWYPSLGGDHDCLEGTPPDWMLQDGYKDHYVFDSHAECCKVSKLDPFPATIALP